MDAQWPGVWLCADSGQADEPLLAGGAGGEDLAALIDRDQSVCLAMQHEQRRGGAGDVADLVEGFDGVGRGDERGSGLGGQPLSMGVDGKLFGALAMVPARMSPATLRWEAT